MSVHHPAYINGLKREILRVSEEGLAGGQIALEPHQLRGYERLCEVLRDTTHHCNLIMACGTGKTWMEVGLLLASERAKRNLGMSSPDLLIYTETAIKKGVLGTLERQGTDFALWEKGKKPNDRAVVVASIQVLQRARETIRKYLPRDIPLIIGDEADLLVTDKRMDLLGQFDSLAIGFSATDTWSDGRSITDAWGDTIYRYSLAEAIADGVVLKPRYQLIQSSVSMDALPYESGEYPLEIVDGVLWKAEIYRGIVSIYDGVVGREKMRTHPTLVSVPSVKLVRRTASEFRSQYGNDIRIRWWTGEDSRGDTVLGDIESYKGGDVDVLIVCQMGGRGMDLPNARVLIDASCTASLTKVSQLHPRVMRRDRERPEDKPDCTIIQIVPTITRSKPKTFFDVIEYGGSDHRNRNGIVSPGQEETTQIEPLPQEVLERLDHNLKLIGNHTLRLVSSFEVESEKVYDLGEDGTVTLGDGRIFAPIEYFMTLFETVTESVAKRRIETYLAKSMVQEKEEGKTQVINLKMSDQIRLRIVYEVSPVRLAYEQDIRTTLYADESGMYLCPNGRKHYTKSELRRLTGTRPNYDFTHSLEGVVVKRKGGTNQSLTVYAYDDYIEAINASAVHPTEDGSYTHDGYQDMPSLERLHPELTTHYKHTRFRFGWSHKPWNPKVGRIEYIILVSRESVEKLYNYLRSIPEVDASGTVKKKGGVYRSKELIGERYGTEVHILERYRNGRFSRIPARVGWREVELFPEKEIKDAHATMLARQTASKAADTGVCFVDGVAYYTTSHIAGIYGFANQQVIEIFRRAHISPTQIDGVQSYLFRKSDMERVFGDADLYPNKNGELTKKEGTYVDERHLEKVFGASIAGACIALASAKGIPSTMGYYCISQGKKERGTFYEKAAIYALAQKMRDL